MMGDEKEQDLDDSLALTQPADYSQPSGEALSQPTDGSLKYWGRLYPLVRSLICYDMTEKVVSVGTGPASSVVIHRDQIGDKKFEFLDNIHFEIQRVFKKPNVLVELTDHSTHGVFINGRKIRPKSLLNTSSSPKKAFLESNDVIGFPEDKHTANYNAFIFVNSYAPEVAYIPQAVKSKYQVTTRLGVGTFGEVHLTFDKDTGIPSAMKSIPFNNMLSKEETYKAKLLNEMNILKSLDHPHIVKLIDTVQHRSGSYMFLEFMDGNDLQDRIQKHKGLKENLAKLLFYQITLGIKYLHDHNIIHRDIKPANVLLASNCVETLAKLADFGLSKALESTMHMKTVCGTKLFAAPELLSAKEMGSKYTAQVDIWSLGVLLYVSLSGTDPFGAQPHLIEKHIMKGLYVMTDEIWQNVSIFAKNLIDSMLEVKPQKRIGVEGILADEWLQDRSMFDKLKLLYESFGYSNELLPCSPS